MNNKQRENDGDFPPVPRTVVADTGRLIVHDKLDVATCLTWGKPQLVVK